MIFYALDRSSPFVVPSVVPMNIGKGATVANKLDILFRKSSRSPKTPSPPLRLSVSCCDPNITVGGDLSCRSTPSGRKKTERKGEAGRDN